MDLTFPCLLLYEGHYCAQFECYLSMTFCVIDTAVHIIHCGFDLVLSCCVTGDAECEFDVFLT